MKNVLMNFLFGFLLLAFACTPPAEQNDGADEASEDTMEEGMASSDDPNEPEVVASTEAYSTVILEGGIASPRKEMTGNIGDVKVTVNYGSPSKKGRDIWGGLVPYGNVWRTGANSGTLVEFSEDVTVEGEALPAGKYSLFTIPSEGEVIVIFNKGLEHWGTGSYDESEDALRVTVTPEAQDESMESLEFMIDEDNLVLAWDTWHVPVAIAAAG
jgi:hypothetical protein